MIVVAISGKRCSGKDLFAKLLEKRFNAKIRALADQFKIAFAEQFDLDAERLIHDRTYKEIYREQMLAWFEEFNHQFPNLLVERVLETECDLLIVSDVRLFKDLIMIQQIHPTVSVYIKCNDEVRTRFGWIFDAKIDEHFTENDINELQCDVVVDNNGDFVDFETAANSLKIDV